MSKRFGISDLVKRGLVLNDKGEWSRLPIKSPKVRQIEEKAPKKGFYEFFVTPIGKPSFQKSDKWRTKDHPNPKLRQRPNVGRWIETKEKLLKESKKQGFVMPKSGAYIKFIIPMPPSWSEKKKNVSDGAPHQQKPDLDNLLKAFFDSVCPNDDSYIYNYHPSKCWGTVGKIEIIIE